ncbi:MAG: hypothetical protein KC561_02950, partial [Myxococcales bacterium]|nr:hypothetical protein [Myxococcales bacterium]
GHVPFDFLFRQLGFAAYPFTALFPLGLAYLAQTSAPETGDALGSQSVDGENEAARAFKGMTLIWFALGVLLTGVAATLTRQFIFIGLFPMAGAVGLMLSDRKYWTALLSSRTVRYLVGFGTIAILAVLTKDLRTTQDLEVGVRGPEVLFEFLVVDGQQTWPKDFALPGVKTYWLLLTALLFFHLFGFLDWADSVPDKLSAYVKRSSKERGGFVHRTKLKAAGLAHRVSTLGAIIVAPIRALFGYATFVLFVVATGIGFAGVTVAGYLPSLSQHLSHRGLIDTYRELADEGEVFYRIGGTDRAAYYLDGDSVQISSGAENPVESLSGISALRDFYCDPEERIFAMLSRVQLAQAYFEVGRESGDREECVEDRDLYVLDARSSRYVLLSNVLEEGESNQNPLAEHIFTQDTLPPTIVRSSPAYTFDDALRLVGYRFVNESGEPITEASVGDTVYIETYFEVLERVSSNREMFIHADHGSERLNGDHDVVDGVFPMNYWVPGEIVRDRFGLKIDRGSSSGPYQILIGFFSGDNRMTVRPTGAGQNRVHLGDINVHGGLL